MAKGVVTALQTAAIVILGLLTGSMFGIWRGYDPAAYSATTFLEVHQGAVLGLNLLLPIMGLVVFLVVALLAVRARAQRRVLLRYALVLALVAMGGIVTRLFNQPINDMVMGWTADSMPADWTVLRDKWWTWHIVRLGLSIGAQIALILAVFAHRGLSTAQQ